jgi:hypothetical protein
MSETPQRTLPSDVPAEGRVGEINLSVDLATSIIRFPAVEGDDNMPVVFTFRGTGGFFIRVNDHRAATIAAYELYLIDGHKDALDAVFSACPCLGRFAVKGEKRTQYVALTDLGVSDMLDSGEEDHLILTLAGTFNKKSFTVPDGAIHVPTGICFIAKRPVKPEPVVVDPLDPAAPVNPMMAKLLEKRFATVG